MLKTLRYDFYKIVKAKTLLIFFLVAVSLALLDPIFVAFSNGEFGFGRILTCPMVIQFLPVVFVAPFVCKDSSSRFLKNVFSEYSLWDKICYVLSKIIYILAVCVVWYIVYMLMSLTVGGIYSAAHNVPFRMEEISFDGTVLKSKSEVLFVYFCYFLNAFTISTVVLFMCLLTKREYIVTVVILIYWLALAYPIYGVINSALGLKSIHEAGFVEIEERFNSVDWFTVFGIQNNIGSGIYDSSGTIDMMAIYKRCALLSTGYSVLFCILSCVLFASKKKC